MKEAIIYLVAIAVAEVITVFYLPLAGIICHMVILVALIVHAVATRYPHRPLLLSLALVPLVRIISLCMPLANIPLIWWFPIIYAPLLAAAMVVMRLLDYSREQVGLTVKWFPVQLVVGLTGVVFGIAEYFILRPEAMIAELTWQAIWLPAVILLLCTGFVEELIFRGVLQRAALEALGGWGIVYISLIFATLHIGFLSWINVVFVFVIALFFGWVVKKTGSLLGVSLSHGIINIVLYLVAPFFLG
ncbi:CPBP family intramembrane metalloprotease [Dehalococcoidales bacterium]|nr:CPBP family intramembrane metalloprotease [Dehalococcoidales bacterium]